MNLLNPSVSEYHLLQIDNSLDSDIMSLLFSNKIKIRHIGKEINRSIFLKYCNEYLKDRTVLYLNQPDVYFDNTLILASTIQYGECVKIYKRLSMVKPFDCERGQGSISEGIIFKTNSQEPFMVNEGDPDWTKQLIIPMTAKIFKTHNCKLAEQINGWFLSDPSQLVYSNLHIPNNQKVLVTKREGVKKE
ncbi:predicted protein [Naegleria gruberi]|nr:uncharacterized protein NAEGRDRAFT_76392 [Naegleria gruberi]EFC35946.1 predicted protein [Naegleria gruberi]|eukprot:XP_002668690.1 predicted protein [Naegleria gruberi strain NEG-M]